MLPDGVAVGANDHAAFDAGVRDEFGFGADIGIPLGEVLVHRGDVINHFLLFVCHNYVNAPF